MLSGAVTIEQLQSNVRALDIGLDPAAMGALAGLAEDPATYWQTRSRSEVELSPLANYER